MKKLKENLIPILLLIILTFASVMSCIYQHISLAIVYAILAISVLFPLLHNFKDSKYE